MPQKTCVLSSKLKKFKMNNLTNEFLEKLVEICQNEVIEYNSNLFKNLKISKLLSSLAYLSCNQQIIKRIKEIKNINEIQKISNLFTIEEKNIFARLQIKCIEIRKKINLNQLQLLSLSPILILVSDEDLIHSLQSRDQDMKQEESNIKKEIEIKKIKSKKGKKMKKSEEKHETNSQIREVSSHSKTDVDIQNEPLIKNTLMEEKGEELIVNTLSNKKKIVDDIPDSKIFFFDEIDPNDNEGWISVSQHQNKTQKNKTKLESKSDKSSKFSSNVTPTKSSPTKTTFTPNSKIRFEKESTSFDVPTNLIENSQLLSERERANNIDKNLVSENLWIKNMSCLNCDELEKKIVDLKVEHTSEIKQLQTQHTQEINELHRKYQEEINELRELHSQALQSIHLKLYIALNNLENERENRNKIIEDSLLKYYQNMTDLKLNK